MKSTKRTDDDYYRVMIVFVEKKEGVIYGLSEGGGGV